MHRFKTLLALLICLVALSGCGSDSGTSDYPKKLENYYYDGAGVLSEATMEHINYSNQDLNDKTGAEVIVACIDTTGFTDIADVAYDMFNQWEIGDSKEQNGVLLLLSIDEEDYWAVQGEGLEKVLSSGKLKTITSEYLEPYFSVGDYNGGVRSCFDAIIDELEAAYSVTVNPNAGWNRDFDYDDGYYEEEGLSFFEGIVGLIIIFWCLSVLFGRKKNGKSHSFFEKYVAYDILKDTVRHMSDRGHRGSGFGGFSGGSFGGSRGGGFRGRSGGGGRTRGGGAGRR